MLIQDKIYDYIRQQAAGTKNSFSAREIAEEFDLNRNAASHYLNRLADNGSLRKSNSRPVKFMLASQLEQNPFAQLIGATGSMERIVQQCKAAVDYPSGLPIILHGKSGTGKSFLAKLIVDYAKIQGVLASEGKLVTLNCADYANNPELISSALFGHVKGAFTGAEKEVDGLLAQADGGFLFLDEVHNLSSENQEKLFLLLDSNQYRKIGSSEWNQAKIRLIMATTEEPAEVLLPTFRRRIPLELELPDFQDRYLNERFALIRAFFVREAKKISKDISVSYSLLEKLANTDYEGNIGELKNRITVLIAENYVPYAEVIVTDSLYPPTNLVVFSSQAEVSMGTVPEILSSEQATIIEEMKDLQRGLECFDELMLSFEKVIKKYVGADLSLESTAQDNFEMKLFDDILKKLKEQKGVIFEADVVRDLRTLFFIYYNFGSSLPLSIAINAKEKQRYYKYYALAQFFCDFRQPKSQEFAVLFLICLLKRNSFRSKIPAVIVMHGKNNASSLAAMANELIKDYSFDAFDMPLEVNSQEISNELIAYTKHVDTRNGMVILVDMGSLQQIYSDLIPYVEGHLLILNNASSLVAVEIANELCLNKQVLEISEIGVDKFNIEKKYFEGVSQRANIIVSCMTGKGTASKLHDIFEQYVDEKNVEILSMDHQYLSQLIGKKDFSIFKDTLAILCIPNIEEKALPIISIERVINGSEDLHFLDEVMSKSDQKGCTNEIIRLFTIKGASARLKFLNPESVVDEVSGVIKVYEEYYSIEIDNFLRINIFLHLSSMIERVLTNDHMGEAISQDIAESKDFEKFMAFSERAFAKIKKKYNIQIPIGEYGVLYQLVRNKLD